VGPWKRYGCDGAYVYPDGAGGMTTGFILEIQPGKADGAGEAYL